VTLTRVTNERCSSPFHWSWACIMYGRLPQTSVNTSSSISCRYLPGFYTDTMGGRTVTRGKPFQLSVNYCRTNTRENFLANVSQKFGTVCNQILWILFIDKLTTFRNSLNKISFRIYENISAFSVAYASQYVLFVILHSHSMSVILSSYRTTVLSCFIVKHVYCTWSYQHVSCK